MSDGARFPWKVQKVVSRGPIADYRNLRDPLPTPPEGMSWHLDQVTREWKLTPAAPIYGSNTEEGTGAGGGTLPPPSSVSSHHDDEWELLSEKNNRAGSVRSLSSMESGHQSNGSCSHLNLSIPFKVQRTHSSSTIDSSENNIHATVVGPAGKGVLGVDYLEHVVLPTDTFQGICLAYKVSATHLRQANHFSGTSLSLAPKRLLVPISKKALRSGYIRVQDTDAKEYKLHAFQAEFPDFSLAEVKAYLELADWHLADAMRSAREDNEWEQEMDGGTEALRSGQIRITLNGGRLQAAGAGMVQPATGATGATTNTSHLEVPDSPSAGSTRSAVVTPPREWKCVTNPEALPDIATKTVKAQDVYQAATQHESYGVELKALRQPLLADDGMCRP